MYAQEDSPCRLLWGRRGVQAAVARRDILVVVDVLRFSSTTVTALAFGYEIVPADPVVVGKTAQPDTFSLSPRSFLTPSEGMPVMLPSPNGSYCCAAASELPHVLVGALLNAAATARAVNVLRSTTGRGITVLACGERWVDDTNGGSTDSHSHGWADGSAHVAADGSLRFALEDYLGAGAILAGIRAGKSPDALVCEAAFRAEAARLATHLKTCASGLELIHRGLEADVDHCVRLDLYDVAVEVRAGRCRPRTSKDQAPG